jgi:hypothetical protein
MSIEKQIRQFVRQTFGARIARTDDGFAQTTKGKTSRITITNPNTVDANLREQCGKPVAEKGNTISFKLKKENMEFSLRLAGRESVLTVVNN